MVLLLPLFYSSPGFLSLGSVLFLFSLSGSAGVGSVGGGGMAVLDGGGGMAVLAFAGEKKLHSAVQNSTVQFVFFFLLKKRKMNLGVTQKWVMTIIMS